MSEWQPKHGDDWHKAALGGRPVLAFGIPRYGPTAARHALVFFETGHGWREVDSYRAFDPTHWMPLPPPPSEEQTHQGGSSEH